jgi:hypothetical protein
MRRVAGARKGAVAIPGISRGTVVAAAAAIHVVRTGARAADATAVSSTVPATIAGTGPATIARAITGPVSGAVTCTVACAITCTVAGSVACTVA